MICSSFLGATTRLASGPCAVCVVHKIGAHLGLVGLVTGEPDRGPLPLGVRISSSSQTEHRSGAMRDDLRLGPPAGRLIPVTMSLGTRVLSSGQLTQHRLSNWLILTACLTH